MPTVMLTEKTPVDCETHEGCLRLLPNMPVEVTQAELETLQGQGVKVSVLAEPTPPKPAAKKSPATPSAKKKKKATPKSE